MLHTHSLYSDGADTMEALVRAAIEKKLSGLGFSDHAYAPYDTECCMAEDALPRYLGEAARLKAKYADLIPLYCGLEGDSLHPIDRAGLDYTIGSVHYLRGEDGVYTVDNTPADFEDALRYVGQGSPRRLVERYYAQIAHMLRTQRHDIVGHLDLIKKLGGDHYFSQDAPWYLPAVEVAVDAIAHSGVIVEVNTRGNYRGHTADFYPSRPVLELLHARHIPVTISSDAHCAQALDHSLAQAAELLRDVGYRSIRQLGPAGFVDCGL